MIIRKESWARIAAVVFILFILIGSFTGYILMNFIYDSADNYNHGFHIHIKPNSSAPFIIKCPFPVNSIGGSYPSFLDELRVTKGNASLSMEKLFSDPPVNHDGGYLSIKGNGETEIDWEATWPAKTGSRYMNLSVTHLNNTEEAWDSTDGNSWVYSDSAIDEFTLSFESTHTYLVALFYGSGGGPSYRTDPWRAHLSIGYQKVPIEYGWIIIN
jgi:hypothetical protein